MINNMSALDPTIADLLGGGQTETIETQTEPEVVDTTVDDSGATEVQTEEVATCGMMMALLLTLGMTI